MSERAPSSRKQAQRVGAKHGRELALRHIARDHLGELNRIRKRLRDERIAATILEGFYYLHVADRWRPIMVRAFQRAALGLLEGATQSNSETSGEKR